MKSSLHLVEILKILALYHMYIGCEVVSDSFRAPHLFGIKLPDSLDATALMAKLKEKKVCWCVTLFYVSDDMMDVLGILP